MSSSAVATIVALVVLVVAIAGWVTYAYLFPHSTSGQILIRVRPRHCVMMFRPRPDGAEPATWGGWGVW